MKYSYTSRNYSCRVGKRDQWLRAYRALTESLVFNLNSHGLRNADKRNGWKPDALSWPPWTLHAHDANKSMQADTGNVLEKS